MMNAIKAQNRGERYVLYVARHAAGKFWAVLALIVAALSVISFSTTSDTRYAVYATWFVALAILYFERWQFSRIIERQQQEIDRLREEQNPK